MAFVYNGTKEDVTVKVCGKYFSFKPEQIKLMDDEKALFISMERKDSGLMTLPQDFEDPSFKETAEGKRILQEAKEQGISNLVDFHRSIIRNNQVSLRRDLARANEKVDAAVEASEGELTSMRLVAKYQKMKEDASQKRIDEVKELMKNVGTL